MQCYICGHEMSRADAVCPACGQPRSRRMYVQLCAVVGGIVGSLIGFTLFNMIGAMAGGCLGIILADAGASVLLRRPGAGASKPS